MPVPPRIVLFDAVGTVLAPSPSVIEVYHRLGCQYSSQLSKAELKKRIAAAREKHFQVGADIDLETSKTLGIVASTGTDLRSSDSIERRLWKQLVSDVFVDLSDVDDLFEDLWIHFASADNWWVYDDVIPCWKTLREAGFMIGLASNFDSRLLEICKTTSPFDTADFIFCSAQVGFRKPSPEFYRHIESALRETLKLTHDSPLEILMVGDDKQNDFAAPKLLGWQAYWLNREAARKNSDSISSFDTRELNSLAALPEVLRRK